MPLVLSSFRQCSGRFACRLLLSVLVWFKYKYTPFASFCKLSIIPTGKWAKGKETKHICLQKTINQVHTSSSCSLFILHTSGVFYRGTQISFSGFQRVGNETHNALQFFSEITCEFHLDTIFSVACHRHFGWLAEVFSKFMPQP